MVNYATRSQLRNIASKLTLVEQASLRKGVSKRSPAGTTFLSHSSKDEELVVGAIQILRLHGALVYVDEKDPEMPPFTNEKTAALLKRRIQQTRRFVMLTSKNSIKSRWVPWELGYADGKKGLANIALFPALDSASETSWVSSEYLGLYRRIVVGRLSGEEKKQWLVWNHQKNTAKSLRDWLRKP